jgi:hypothetical protein
MLTEEAAHCLSILRLVLALPEQTTDRHIKLHMATAVKDALTTILNDVYDGGAEEQLAKDHDEKELKKQQLERHRRAKMQLEAVWGELDTDKSGDLSREEVRIALQRMERELSEEELEALFLKLDIDSDSNVSFSEFLVWWEWQEQREQQALNIQIRQKMHVDTGSQKSTKTLRPSTTQSNLFNTRESVDIERRVEEENLLPGLQLILQDVFMITENMSMKGCDDAVGQGASNRIDETTAELVIESIKMIHLLVASNGELVQRRRQQLRSGLAPWTWSFLTVLVGSASYLASCLGGSHDCPVPFWLVHLGDYM